MKKSLIALVALAILSISVVANAADIRVKGSTTVDPAMKKLVAAYQAAHPGVNFSISATGSGDGAKAVINKTADIGMMSRDMKPAEIKKCKANGIEPVQFIIALDCLVPIVNPSNPVSAITTAQLKDMYQDKIRNWSEVGGEKGMIALFSRETNSGTYEVWHKKVMKKEDEFDLVSRMPSNAAMAAKISGNKKGIGYVGLGFLNPKIKALTVNGVVASVATGKDGSYPLSRGLNLYTGGQPTGETKTFIDFVMSPAGQKIIAEVGFVPVK
ncbi:PstS family phosphate ABC transporter substrate-binding protein [Pseudodesulfovibrio sediminis]|uniref:Phosphate-binding protein n=1 Tax=Pseudodesulfovibrio sediminis TaxID=2810563 RepID=A0ABM7P7G1_9BACT|nr:PstS family phosphate ABC transporter substrate-binding protein [Pseudodesulfovibrio sediminis]BCS88871.1 phosphate ABC transporter substrate-binding protein [Pseudodesulfovibrio sediminis]